MSLKLLLLLILIIQLEMFQFSIFRLDLWPLCSVVERLIGWVDSDIEWHGSLVSARPSFAMAFSFW